MKVVSLAYNTSTGLPLPLFQIFLKTFLISLKNIKAWKVNQKVNLRRCPTARLPTHPPARSQTACLDIAILKDRIFSWKTPPSTKYYQNISKGIKAKGELKGYSKGKPRTMLCPPTRLMPVCSDIAILKNIIFPWKTHPKMHRLYRKMNMHGYSFFYIIYMVNVLKFCTPKCLTNYVVCKQCRPRSDCCWRTILFKLLC